MENTEKPALLTAEENVWSLLVMINTYPNIQVLILIAIHCFYGKRQYYNRTITLTESYQRTTESDWLNYSILLALHGGLTCSCHWNESNRRGECDWRQWLTAMWRPVFWGTAAADTLKWLHVCQIWIGVSQTTLTPAHTRIFRDGLYEKNRPCY